MDRVDQVGVGILVILLVFAGVISLINIAGAVAPLFLAIVWGWAYARCKIAGDKAFWPIRKGKKETDEELKEGNTSTEPDMTTAATEEED
ncbi:MAG: hypothetical protein ACXACF_05310 [Candidatus Hermodarchaeia archaeon]